MFSGAKYLLLLIILWSCSSINPGLEENRYFNQEFSRHNLISKKRDSSIVFFQFGMYKSTEIFPYKNMEIRTNPGLLFEGNYPTSGKEAFQDFNFEVSDTLKNKINLKCSYYAKDVLTHYSNSYSEETRKMESFKIDISEGSENISLVFDLADTANFAYNKSKIYLKRQSITSGSIFFNGYFFELNNENIAAVHLGKKGIYWHLDELNDQLKIILASASIALFSHPGYYFP